MECDIHMSMAINSLSCTPLSIDIQFVVAE